MAQPIDIATLTEAQLSEQFVTRKLVTQGQLKAALDYQASVGGKLIHVLVKLGLVRAEALELFLERLAAGEDFIMGPGGQVQVRPESVQIHVEKLRVHRKLFEKVPRELSERCGLLFFFPPPGMRAILVSADPPLADKGIRMLQELLCVELLPIDLSPEERAAFEAGESVPPREISACEETEIGVGAPIDEPTSHAGERPRTSSSDPTEPDLEEPAPPASSGGVGSSEGSASADSSAPDATSAGEAPHADSGSSAAAGGETDDRPPSRQISGVTSFEYARVAAQELLAANGEASVPEESSVLLQALIQLLVKKKLLGEDEIAVELSLIERARLREPTT